MTHKMIHDNGTTSVVVLEDGSYILRHRHRGAVKFEADQLEAIIVLAGHAEAAMLTAEMAQLVHDAPEALADAALEEVERLEVVEADRRAAAAAAAAEMVATREAQRVEAERNLAEALALDAARIEAEEAAERDTVVPLEDESDDF